jgi:transcriptional regulator with XRE-family HTH domain
MILRCNDDDCRNDDPFGRTGSGTDERREDSDHGRPAFRDKIVGLCEKKGWSQSDLWRALGQTVSRNTISRWWNGKVVPYHPSIIDIAKALEVSLDFLTDDALDNCQPSEIVTDDERSILRVYRALELTEDEALRALSSVSRDPPDWAAEVASSAAMRRELLQTGLELQRVGRLMAAISLYKQIVDQHGRSAEAEEARNRVAAIFGIPASQDAGVSEPAVVSAEGFRASADDVSVIFSRDHADVRFEDGSFAETTSS